MYLQLKKHYLKFSFTHADNFVTHKEISSNVGQQVTCNKFHIKMAAGTYISAAHLKAVMQPPFTFTVSTISKGSINQLSDVATRIS